MNSFEKADQAQQWIDDYINDILSKEDFHAFERQLAVDSKLRAQLRQSLALDDNLRENLPSPLSAVETWNETTSVITKFAWKPVIAAALLAIGLTMTGISFFSKTEHNEQISFESQPAETLAEGFAVLHELDGNHDKYQVGRALGAGSFMIEEGAAELHFFSGARVVLEAPAEINICSAWEAKFVNGKLRAEVPPAARGFKLTTDSSEIIDLGTEFALEVSGGNAVVEVIDGEVAVMHRDEDEARLTTGEACYLPKLGSSEMRQSSTISFPKKFLKRKAERKKSFDRWEQESNEIAQDDRLLAYYNFQNVSSSVPNLAQGKDSFSDASLVMATKVEGRWPGHKEALDFRRAGARARVNIPGEFGGLSLTSWVRIDSLDRSYSALLMGDGYETGEPHWQIRDDGRLMLSVMVDDSRKPVKNPLAGGIHKVYFSPVVWDISKSGEWMHLASTYDPDQRTVRHFINGEQVSEATIERGYIVKTLRIGAGEIGNWGQPFRRTPTFAIRNLNGRIDELGVYGEALNPDEIKSLYERTKVSF